MRHIKREKLSSLNCCTENNCLLQLDLSLSIEDGNAFSQKSSDVAFIEFIYTSQPGL